jgi:hypothetical protein
MTSRAAKKLKGPSILGQVQLGEIAAVVRPSSIHDPLGKEWEQPRRFIRPVQVRKAEEVLKALNLECIAHVAEPVACFVALKDADGLNRTRHRMLPGHGEASEDRRRSVGDVGVLDDDVTPRPRHQEASLG